MIHHIRPHHHTIVLAIVFTVCASASLINVSSGAEPATLSRPLPRSGDMEVRLNQGLLDYQLGRMKDAERSFRAVLAELPDDLEARFHLALALIGQGEYASALSELDRVVTVAPAFSVARSARATALIHLRRFSDAEAELSTLEQTPEFRSNALSLRGTMLYEQGRYPEAAEMFARAREAGADQAPEASLLRGLALYRAGDVAGSREALRQAAGIDVDPSIAIAARQLHEGERARAFQFDLSAGYEYDSNVGLFEQGITLPSNVSHRDDGRFVLEPRARLSLVQTPRLEAGLSTTNYFSYQSRLSDFDVASYQVGAFVNYWLRDNVQVGFRYDFNTVELGHDPYLKRNFVTPAVTIFEKNFGYTGLFYQFDAAQYESVAGTERLDRDGQTGGAGIVQSVDLPEFFQGAGRAEMQFIGRFRNQQTKGQDFDGDLYGAGVTLFIPMPGKFSADVGVNFDYEDYAHANSLDQDNRQRNDFEYSFSAGLMRRINQWMAVRAEYSYVNHDSNILTAPDPASGLQAENPYEFSHHVVGVKMIFTY